MKEQDGLDNKKYFGNVKNIITQEFFFDIDLKKYDEIACLIESSTYNQKGKILTKSCQYTRRYGDMMGFDLENSSTEYFYNENDLIEKIINYDKDLKIDCITEYSYNVENKLIYIKFDSIVSYLTTEFRHTDNKLIKILTNSITGIVKKDIIHYDYLNRIISEESIYEEIKGNYPIKNPSKKYYYDDASYIIEHYFDKIINTKETYLNSGKLINRINYDESGKLYSIVNVHYNENIITTLHNKANGELIHKRINYLDENNNPSKVIVYKNGDITETEIITKYDEFKNCIYEEIVGFSRTIIQYEYE